VSAGAPLSARTRSVIGARREFALYNCYGSSEAGAVTLGVATEEQAADDAGPPLPGVEVSLAQATDPGQHAELLIRGSSLAAGYVGAGGLVPLRDAEGWYRTGDLGEIRDGRLHLLGRCRNLINVAGKKVSPLQIERVLADHPAVADVQVTALADDVRGQIPVARVVPLGDVTVSQLVEWCRQRLASYEMPRRIELVPGLPRSATGKILDIGMGRS